MRLAGARCPAPVSPPPVACWLKGRRHQQPAAASSSPPAVATDAVSGCTSALPQSQTSPGRVGGRADRGECRGAWAQAAGEAYSARVCAGRAHAAWHVHDDTTTQAAWAAQRRAATASRPALGAGRGAACWRRRRRDDARACSQGRADAPGGGCCIPPRRTPVCYKKSVPSRCYGSHQPEWACRGVTLWGGRGSFSAPNLCRRITKICRLLNTTRTAAVGAAVLWALGQSGWYGSDQRVARHAYAPATHTRPIMPTTARRCGVGSR